MQRGRKKDRVVDWGRLDAGGLSLHHAPSRIIRMRRNQVLGEVLDFGVLRLLRGMHPLQFHLAPGMDLSCRSLTGAQQGSCIGLDRYNRSVLPIALGMALVGNPNRATAAVRSARSSSRH
jgi:hypothetical protein